LSGGRWEVGSGMWVCRESASGVWLMQCPKPPPRPSPKGRELYSMRDASHRQSVGCGQNLLATSHRSLAGSKTPTPALPQGEGELFSVTKPWINGAARAPDQVRGMPRLAGAQHPWPGTRLRLFTDSLPIPRTRPGSPAEIRGPYRKRSRNSVAADAPTLECRGGFKTLPYLSNAEGWAWRFCGHMPFSSPTGGGGGEAAGGGLFARGWDVGCGMWVGHESAPCVWLLHRPKPTPALPKGEGALLDAKRGLQALGWLRTEPTSHKPQATSRFPNPHPAPLPRGGAHCRLPPPCVAP